MSNRNMNLIIEGLHINESGMNDKVKTWYKETFPDDELGNEINGRVTFRKLYDTLTKGADFYRALGVGDSTVRERVFSEIATRNKSKYDTIYDLWQYGGWDGIDRHKMGMDNIRNSIY